MHFICNFFLWPHPITLISNLSRTLVRLNFFQLPLSRSFLPKKPLPPYCLWQQIQTPGLAFKSFICLDLLVLLFFFFPPQSLFSLISGHFKYPAFTFPIEIPPVLWRPCSVIIFSLKSSLALQTHIEHTAYQLFEHMYDIHVLPSTRWFKFLGGVISYFLVSI